MPYADIGGLTLHYVDRGSGPVAVFIHGFPLDHSMWLDQVNGLADVRRCIAFDLRGFGRSEATSDRVLSMETLADDVVRLVEAIGESPCDVVALSMGGYVALALWEAAPSLVRSLTLIDTRATADGADARANREAMIERLLTDGRAALAAEMAGALLSGSAGVEAQARVRSMAEGTRYETLIASIRGMRDRVDRTEALATITVPTLVIGGEEDRLIPEADTRALGASIPGARVAIVPGAGHLPPIEQPEAVNRALADLWG
jgi:3-oxoadipate enol-lactonase